MLFWLFITLLLAAAGVAGWWGYRMYVTGDTSFNFGRWFAPRPEPRLGISEQAVVDSRRRLVLIRRDDVEHLIMIGGPIDMVIENNIRAGHTEIAEKAPVEPAQPVFARQPRTLGQAVNE